jgi:hypothetical protein
MRRIRSSALTFAALTWLAGCASTFHQAPFIAYEDKSRPLSDTSVFSALDKDRRSESRIARVDGVPTSCFQVGCPYWVRVPPGRHVFTVNYLVPGLSSSKYADVEVIVEDMKPRHVYRATYIGDGASVAASVQDLGENPDYGIPLYLDGKVFRVQF